MYYIHKDHLGSFDKIGNESGVVVDSYSFDAWGNRCLASAWNSPDNVTHLFDRGFTGHEHLDKFGLINMNGRMYDPLLGRFLSPDNDVQEINNTQNFNRYSYCLNNPLKYIDPSGNNFLDFIFETIFTPFRLVNEGVNCLNESINGNNNYSYNWNYVETGNLAHTWRDDPNIVLGPNGYPDGYSAFGKEADDNWIGNNSISIERYLWGHWSSDWAPIYENRYVYEQYNDIVGQPKNAQQLYLILYNMKFGETIEGGTLNKDLNGITITRHTDGFNLKLPYLKEKIAKIGGYDPNHRFTLEKKKWTDGNTDVIVYRELYKGKWGILNYIHNDGVRYDYKMNAQSYPHKIGHRYQVGNGQW